MNKSWAVVLLYIFLLSCDSKSSSTFESFREKILSYSSDNLIEEKEYQDLVSKIANSNDSKFQNFKSIDGQVDNKKLASYIVAYCSANKLTISEASIWKSKTKTQSFNVNVFIENSASMDGYVNGVTEFETAIYNLLGDIKIAGICDSLNLHYINNTIPYTKKNALAPDIEDFIMKLEPATFKLKGGNRGSTDVKNVLSEVLKDVDDKSLAILVSDFVFSPGNSANAQQFLNNQSVGIKIDFAEKIKTFDLALVVIQLQSTFNGSYYDKQNIPVTINGKRPYYIWLIGSTKQIETFFESNILNHIRGGYQNRLVLHKIDNTEKPRIKIQSRPIFGRFDKDNLSNNLISHASPSQDSQSKDLFGFNVAVDFSNSLNDSMFHSDTLNYRISDTNYKFKITTINSQSSPLLTGYTHMFEFKTSKLISENLQVDLIGKVPEWVNFYSSYDDSNIKLNSSEMQKTFGLSYLMNGVVDAFYPQAGSIPISSIIVTIDK